MASNSPFRQNTSALARSALAAYGALQSLKDAEAAQEYSLSDKSDAAFNKYADYLNGRIGREQSIGTNSSASNAISLQNTYKAAYHANVQSSIAKENIAMLTGGASTADKLSLVTSQALRARGIGDLALEQQLEEQVYGLQQQVQKEQADARVASATIAKVTAALSSIPGMEGKIPAGAGSADNSSWVQQITAAAKKYGVDPHAALAVASAEGLSGAVGDGGTSFGPFQLHVGGALPAGKGRAWAESAEGIDYAMKTIAGVAKGLTGVQAVTAIVNKFERPANPTGEISRAMAVYGNVTSGGSASASQSNFLAGSANLGDIATNITDYAKGVEKSIENSDDPSHPGVKQIDDLVKQMNNAITILGPGDRDKAIKQFTDAVRPAYQALQIDIPADVAPNYGDLLKGAYLAKQKLLAMASKVAAGYDEDLADRLATQANSYATREATIPSIVKGASKMNLNDIEDLITSLADPNSHSAAYYQSADGSLGKKPLSAQYLQFKDGNVVPAYISDPNQNLAAHPEQVTHSIGKDKTGKEITQPDYVPNDDPNSYVSAPLNLTLQLNKLGLQFNAGARGAQQGGNVTVKPDSSPLITKLFKAGTNLTAFNSPQGLQLSGADAKYGTKAIYYVVSDGAHRQAIYEESMDARVGSRLVSAESGYSAYRPGTVAAGSPHSAGFLDHFVDAIKSSAGNMTYGSVFGGGMINSANARSAQLAQQAKIAEANHAAALAMLSRPAPALPQVHVNNTPLPSAPLPVYRPPALAPVQINRAPQPVAPHTVNPQPVSPVQVQKPAPINLQGGGGFRLQ